MNKSDAAMTTTQEQLMRTFDFTEDDLSANRRGAVSEHQHDRLRGMAHGIGGWSFTLIALGFVFLGSCLILAMFLQNEDTRAVLFSDPLNVLLLGLSILVALAAIIGAKLWSRKQGEGLVNAPLQKAEGKAQVTATHFEHGGYGYRIQVGDKKYNFIEEYGRCFKDGTTYCIYYCKSGPYDPILSVDVLEETG
jgi:membrane protein implicated in regulation of membrane protease activity